tara:strand:+ start:464 stop:580 length:117 start_codon:yes stop_codon:yes gene_type:complete
MGPRAGIGGEGDLDELGEDIFIYYVDYIFNLYNIFIYI